MAQRYKQSASADAEQLDAGIFKDKNAEQHHAESEPAQP